MRHERVQKADGGSPKARRFPRGIGMAKTSGELRLPSAAANSLEAQRVRSGEERTPSLCLGLDQGDGKPTIFEYDHECVLIGTVPGCDLRLSGRGLPSLIC